MYRLVVDIKGNVNSVGNDDVKLLTAYSFSSLNFNV